jgi:2-keto-4-pentenoate hydratase/2-oxohepta-3-ene-1,7-dioic acid hydratase in catechol pathway
MNKSSLRLARAQLHGGVVLLVDRGDDEWRVVADGLDASAFERLIGREDLYESLEQCWSKAPSAQIEAAKILLPLTRTPKIFCIGFNFPAEGRQKGPFPTVFLRTRDSFVAHGTPIVRPRVSDSLDWEGEMAIVVGRSGRAISRDDSWRHIAGFTCLADNTVREYSKHGTQATAGKNFESTGAVGPWIRIVADEQDARDSLNGMSVKTRIDGLEVQSGEISELLFGVDELISYVSSFSRLNPGDVIASGTPGGIGLRMDPVRFLQPGEVIEVEVSGIGVLQNRVVEEGHNV